MAQAPIEPGNPLFEVATNLDLNKVPEKLHCAKCQQFLLNAFKTACCESAICENCNNAKTEDGCPLCNHKPFISNPSKAVRGTARAYLKTVLQNSESTKPSEISITPAVPVIPSVPTELEQNHSAENELTENTITQSQSMSMEAKLGDDSEQIEEKSVEDVLKIVQSIEEPEQTLARRSTLESFSGNEHDDDIEIHVGPVDEPIDPSMVRQSQFDDDPNEFSKPIEEDKAQKMANEEQNEMFPGMNDSSFQNMSNMNMNMPFMNPQQMMQNMQQMMMMNGFNQNMPGFSMGYGQNFNPMMMGFGNMNEMLGMNQGNFQGFGQNMWNNDASSNNMPQQFSQFPSGDYHNWQNFDGRGRGRGRKFRGRGRGAFGYQNYGYHNTHESYQNGFQNFQNSSMQYGGQMSDQPTTNEKELEPNPEDDDFAPGGQDEVQEALGDKYDTSKADEAEDATLNPPAEDVKTKEEPQNLLNPSPEPVENQKSEPVQAEVDDENIPEAYREDLEGPMAPPTAPLGPASKDYTYRPRGHGRYASRGGRGSFQGLNGHIPVSPARTNSQPQIQSPTTSKGTGLGVVGAPTGPKAMREREPSISKQPLRVNGDTGFKIVGRAAMQPQEAPQEDSRPRSPTPRSTYDDYDDRDRDRDKDRDRDRDRDRERESSRKYSKYDSKRDSTKNDDYYEDDYDRDRDRDRDRRRRKSRREEDYDQEMEDRDQNYSRSNSSERKSSYRSSRREREREREKEKEKEKYSSNSSKHRSSRRHEDEGDDYDMDGYGEPVESKSYHSSKKSSKYDDRDREYDRDDKPRKRSRHERDRDDGYEDVDEEESRHRSRKHKRDHRTSRKDHDRDYDEADLGMRISGRSNSHRTSEVPTPTSATAEPEKDPHTLEREARNRERMLKEEQRRQKAAQGLSGGRRVSYKYEDEIERGMSKSSRRR